MGTFGGNWSNLGTVSLANGATLNLAGTTTGGGLGLAKFVRSGQTTVNLSGSVDNAGGTITLGPASGVVRLNGGTINGGTIIRSGGGDLAFTGSAGALVGATLVGDATFSESSATTPAETVAITGSATLGASGALVNYEYDATIGLGRTINLENACLRWASRRPRAPLTARSRSPARWRRPRAGHQRQLLRRLEQRGRQQRLDLRRRERRDVDGQPQPPDEQRHVAGDRRPRLANVSTVSFTNANGRLRGVAGGRVKATSIAGNLNDSGADGPAGCSILTARAT